MDELERLGLRYGTDKVTCHNYHPWYTRHFEPLRQEQINLLEIGVAQGASLRMWESYFPQARIFGIDSSPKCQAFNSERCKIFIGDQADAEFLHDVSAEIAAPLDIVIDDGGHLMNQQQVTLRTMFPYLRPGGYFVMEDVETSYYPNFGGGAPGFANTTIETLKRVIDEIQKPYHHQSVDAFALENEDAPWQTLEIVDALAENNTDFARCDDASWMAIGSSPDADTYVLQTRSPFRSLARIRLEAIPHAALPGNGPGRAQNGNFVITGITLRTHGAASDVATPRYAAATFEQVGWPSTATLDGSPASGWGIDPKCGETHHIEWHFDPPVFLGDNGSLTVSIQQHLGSHHTLGRFRLFATDRPSWPNGRECSFVRAMHVYRNICFLERD